MSLRAVWDFIAGESRLAPVGVAMAIVTALVLRQFGFNDGQLVGGAFVGLIARGRIAGVFERV